MDSISVTFIKDQISRSISLEQEQRNYRKSLEQLLANAAKTLANVNQQVNREKLSVKPNNQPTKTQQIGDALVAIMCYGGDWRLGDIRKRAGEELSFEVANSTLKYTLKRDGRFDKTDDGLYYLTAKGLEEAKQHCAANDEK